MENVTLNYCVERLVYPHAGQKSRTLFTPISISAEPRPGFISLQVPAQYENRSQHI